MIHEFNPVDKEQYWFKRLRVSLEARLQRLRENNDKPVDAEATALIRGQIEEIKRLIKDMDAKPIQIKK